MKEQIKNTFKDVWNVPNVLTMLRMALIPVFVILFTGGHTKWALAVFLIASLTDLLDGYIARKYQLITNFGKLMDPLADKLMVLTALFCQGAAGVFPWVAVAIVLVKETLMVLGGMYMLRRGIVVHSLLSGKLAMCSFVAALVLSFFHAEFLAWGVPVDSIVLWLSVALTLLAMFDYLRDSIIKLRALKQ